MSSNPHLVLAIGAAGSAAGEVVPALLERGARVRGMVHRPDRQDAVRRRGAEDVVVGDLHDPADLKSAMAGVDAVFYLAPAFIADEAEVGKSVIDAAVRAGVRRLVFSSVIHPVLGLVNHAAKAPVEEALYDSGLEYTVLQPTLFFQNFAGVWATTLQSGVLAEPWSTTTRFSRVDYRDVAAAAAIALTQDRLLGGTFELAADGHLDRHDVAALIGEVTGREIRAERIAPDQLKNTPAPLRVMFEHYDHSGLLSNPLVLTAVLGCEPRTLRSYFSELADRAPLPESTLSDRKP